MKKLIINADDVGFSLEINEAVRKCFENKAITGASIMACGRRFDEACRMLKEQNVRQIGAHLTLTGGLTPATESKTLIGSLLDGGDTFVSAYKDFARLLAGGNVAPEEIFIEFENQLKKITDSGFTITHIDSHEHIHLFPAVFDAVIKLAKKFNISYIRIPVEKFRVVSKEFKINDLFRFMALRAFTIGEKKRLARNTVSYNDAFLGHFHSGRINQNVLSFMLRTLGEGVTELAVHPAVESESFIKEYPWYKNASHELNVLLDGQWKQTVQSEKIQLISHSDIAT
ncbi:MAG: ChbG/HpnK family deacetylase [Candidatus Omnitrophica bacterium]|nr:ChbG/HpnK family deacetylase [Candidatus Omnitrophota bacterium]